MMVPACCTNAQKCNGIMHKFPTWRTIWAYYFGNVPALARWFPFSPLCGFRLCSRYPFETVPECCTNTHKYGGIMHKFPEMRQHGVLILEVHRYLPTAVFVFHFFPFPFSAVRYHFTGIMHKYGGIMHKFARCKNFHECTDMTYYFGKAPTLTHCFPILVCAVVLPLYRIMHKFSPMYRHIGPFSLVGPISYYVRSYWHGPLSLRYNKNPRSIFIIKNGFCGDELRQ